MKISLIRLQNFRSFKDETINLAGYSCFVGPNGAGKSTVLDALNIFFRDSFHSGKDNTTLKEEDFHNKDTSNPIQISVTLTDLSPDAQEEFKHYYRLNKLTITAKAEFDTEKKSASVIQYGQREVMKDFSLFFEGNKKVDELKRIYNSLREKFPDLPEEKKKINMTEALRIYEEGHPELCELQVSEDTLFGFTGGTSRLEKHVQWIYIPAVKEISSEQVENNKTALGKLLARTVRSKVNFDDDISQIRSEVTAKYNKMLEAQQGELDSLSEKLQKRLQEWAHPDVRLKLSWKNDADNALKISDPTAKSILGEGAFDGPLENFGHGFQRSYLLAILQELANLDDEDSPTLILACEEPELYQHPPQAKYLAELFTKLVARNSQIFVSTHSPYFVSGKNFENVRYVSKRPPTYESKVKWLSHDDLIKRIAEARNETPPRGTTGPIAKIHQSLQPQINEMFFTSTLILVEGQSDLAYITSYMHLSGFWEEFRRYGCHIVPVNKKSELCKPIAIAKELGIRFFVIADSDSHLQSEPSKWNKSEKDNLAIFKLCGISGQKALLTEHFWSTQLVMWHTDIERAFESDIVPDKYIEIKNATELEYNQNGGLNKNTLFIGSFLNNLWEEGHRSSTLKQLCENIIAFAGDAGSDQSPQQGLSETVSQELDEHIVSKKTGVSL